jgi:hypothetical protein
MPSLFSREKAVPLAAKLLSALALLLSASLAMAQNNLGELLDAGGKSLSPDAFKEELVQRVIVGRTATGGRLELMYAANGMVEGIGSNPDSFAGGVVSLAPINGEWTIGDNGRICTSMRIGSGLGSVILPARCQFWFKYAEQYFFSDSDTDRGARVFRRTVKQ